MTKIKLAVADDNEKFRGTIVKLLTHENDFEVVLQAENGKQLIEKLREVVPDIILMDIRMPEMDGIEASEKIRQSHPHIKIVAISQYDLEANIIEMNIRGVKSFIGKEDDPDELFRAIRIVKDGGAYMTNRSTEIVQRYLSNASKYQSELPYAICEDEKTLIKMIMEGLTSKEISKKINKSHRTVDDMREKLYIKFDVKNKEQLISLTAKWNLV